MLNNKRRPSPRLRGEVAGMERSGVEVDGGKLSLKTVVCESAPPSPLRGTSPRKRGEEPARLEPRKFSPLDRNLTGSALHCYGPIGLMADNSHA